MGRSAGVPAPASRAGQGGGSGASWRRHPLLYKALRFTLLAAIWGTIVLGLAIVYFISSVPDPIIAALDDRPPNVTILAEDGTVLAERGLRRGHVRLDVLPPYLAKAVIATEDRRFYQHFGIDPLGLRARVVPQRVAPAPWSRAARPSPSSSPRTCSFRPSAP